MPSESPTPLPTRRNPLGRDGSISRCCSTRMVGMAIIFIFSMRIWITGMLDYRKQEASHGQWTLTNAVVVGVNTTRKTVQGTYYNFDESLFKTYYCPLLNYESPTGENITAIVGDSSDCFQSLNE